MTAKSQAPSFKGLAATLQAGPVNVRKWGD